MLNKEDVLNDLRTVGVLNVMTRKDAELLTLLLNKRLEKFLPPRISEARVREIVRDEIKKAGE